MNGTFVMKQEPLTPMDFFNNLTRFDIYTKLDDDFRVQTSYGATLSLVAWVVISFLVLGEFRTFMTPTMKELLKVDTTFGHKLHINLDITFHALTCAEAHVDAMDVAGDNQIDIHHDMYKQRLTANGKSIGAFDQDAVGKNVKHENADKLPANYCGSCYGADTDLTRCCNTCIALKKAYQAKGWGLTDAVKSSEQCQRIGEQPYAHVEPGEGCRIKGSMFVNKVAGNFHIAHGESIVKDGRHIHQFLPAEAHTFNISHTINSVSFGDFNTFPGQAKPALNNVKFMVAPDGSTGLKQYFIKVVPTLYEDATWLTSVYRYGNQYTFTERFRPLMLPDPKTGALTQQMAVLPGIFFVYDVQPFQVHSIKSGMPISHLLTRLLAIVGGVFSVLGMADSLIYRVNKFLGRSSK